MVAGQEAVAVRLVQAGAGAGAEAEAAAAEAEEGRALGLGGSLRMPDGEKVEITESRLAAAAPLLALGYPLASCIRALYLTHWETHQAADFLLAHAGELAAIVNREEARQNRLRAERALHQEQSWVARQAAQRALLVEPDFMPYMRGRRGGGSSGGGGGGSDSGSGRGSGEGGEESKTAVEEEEEEGDEGLESKEEETGSSAVQRGLVCHVRFLAVPHFRSLSVCVSLCISVTSLCLLLVVVDGAVLLHVTHITRLNMAFPSPLHLIQAPPLAPNVHPRGTGTVLYSTSTSTSTMTSSFIHRMPYCHRIVVSCALHCTALHCN